MHQYHSRRDHLRAPLSHLVLDEAQLIEDLNSARAKLGTAANLHYVRSNRKGTPTLLSRGQIAYLCHKNKTPPQKKRYPKSPHAGRSNR
jgi:hypothetical protein